MNKVETSKVLADFVALNEFDLKKIEADSPALKDAVFAALNAISNRFGDSTDLKAIYETRARRKVTILPPIDGYYYMSNLRLYLETISVTEYTNIIDKDVIYIQDQSLVKTAEQKWLNDPDKLIWILPQGIYFLFRINTAILGMNKASYIDVSAALADYEPFFEDFLEGKEFWDNILRGNFSEYYDNIDFYNMFWNLFNNDSINDSVNYKELLKKLYDRYGSAIRILPAFYRNIFLFFTGNEQQQPINTSSKDVSVTGAFNWTNTANKFQPTYTWLDREYFRILIDSLSGGEFLKMSFYNRYPSSKECELLSLLGVKDPVYLCGLPAVLKGAAQTPTQPTQPAPSTTQSIQIPTPPAYLEKNYVAKPLTNWTPAWKQQGLRPSVQRSAANSKRGDVGLGNNGEIYMVDTDKNGTQRWMKMKSITREMIADSNSTSTYNFADIEDYKLMLDLLVYEMMQANSLSDVDMYTDARELFSKFRSKLKNIYP